MYRCIIECCVKLFPPLGSLTVGHLSAGNEINNHEIINSICSLFLEENRNSYSTQ